MELFLKKNGRYSFTKEETRKVIKIDEEREERKAIMAMIDKVLPDLGKLDRLVRNVGADITRTKVLFTFKLKRRFYQAMVDRSLMTDEATIKKIFTKILRRELRDLEWVR